MAEPTGEWLANLETGNASELGTAQVESGNSLAASADAAAEDPGATVGVAIGAPGVTQYVPLPGEGTYRRTFTTSSSLQRLVQVRRIARVENWVEVYEYAYISDTLRRFEEYPIYEPLPSEVVWLETEGTPPAGYVAWMMVESTMGGIKAGKGKGAICVSCESQFPISEMTKIRGKWYCNRNGCAEDQR